MVGSNKVTLTIELLESKLSYDPSSGDLRWLVTSCRRKAGDVAGSDNGVGYIQIGLLGHVYHAHRLGWALAHKIWPIPHGIDHINGIRSDNRLCNLRAANQSENMRNRGPGRSSTTGIKGVYKHPAGGYTAQIGHNYKTIYLGYFSEISDAASAYEKAAKKYHRDFRRL